MKLERGLRVEVADRILGWTHVQQVDGTFMKTWMGREPGDDHWGLVMIPEVNWSLAGQVLEKFRKLPADSPLRANFTAMLLSRGCLSALDLTPESICQSALDAIS